MRVNIYNGLDGINMALRLLSDKIPTVDELKLLPSVKTLRVSKRLGDCGRNDRGLEIHNLASILNIINHNNVNIITIEDPIEYIIR